MTIEDFLQALPTREVMASAIGLEPKSSATTDLFTAFGTGMLLGAGLAMLFAPKAGSEIRHDIGEKLGEIGEHLQSQVSQTAASTNLTSA